MQRTTTTRSRERRTPNCEQLNRAEASVINLPHVGDAVLRLVLVSHLSRSRTLENAFGQLRSTTASRAFRDILSRLALSHTSSRMARAKSSTSCDLVTIPFTFFSTNSFGPPVSETMTGAPQAWRRDRGRSSLFALLSQDFGRKNGLSVPFALLVWLRIRAQAI